MTVESVALNGAPEGMVRSSLLRRVKADTAPQAATDGEVLTLRGLLTYYVPFFIHLQSRRICLVDPPVRFNYVPIPGGLDERMKLQSIRRPRRTQHA